MLDFCSEKMGQTGRYFATFAPLQEEQNIQLFPQASNHKESI